MKSFLMRAHLPWAPLLTLDVEKLRSWMSLVLLPIRQLSQKYSESFPRISSSASLNILSV